MKILVLEDDLKRVEQFEKRLSRVMKAETKFVDNADDCIYALKNETYDLIFLDHDLGGKIFVDENNKNTGSEVARWIEQNPLQEWQTVIVHSLNPIGAKYMIDAIDNATHIPFVWDSKVFNKTFKALL